MPDDELTKELRQLAKVNPQFEELVDLPDQQDGAALLTQKLPQIIAPEVVADPNHLSRGQRIWELLGLRFIKQTRFHEATAIFHGLYDQMLASQSKGEYAHKGMPLVWLSDCYRHLNCPVLSKRYLMLTLCEDAIGHKGAIPLDVTGVYFRLIWAGGISHKQFEDYAARIWSIYQQDPIRGKFPERILMELDQTWMTEFPTMNEASLYIVSTKYVEFLLSEVRGDDGKALEALAHYVLSAMPGCRAKKRQRSHSTDYDIVCTMEGPEIDFRSDLGRYFIVECKDWKTPADFSAFAKFCRVLDSTKCRFGILCSSSGISGTGHNSDAEREQQKVFQDRGMVVAVLSLSDLTDISNGTNLITLLRERYENIRLDLRLQQS